MTHYPFLFISIQVLDGIGAGIFGTLFFVVISDLTRAIGHYNLALGASGACWGLSAALRNGVAGMVVDSAAYSAAFIFLAGCAVAALLPFCISAPETRAWVMTSSNAARSLSAAAD